MARFGRAAGKRPGAFPRTPFAASVRKISAYIDFLISRGLRSAAAAELRRPLTSRPYCSGALGFLLFALQKENLARLLRARGLPARNDRVWADTASGCYRPLRASASEKILKNLKASTKPRLCFTRSLRSRGSGSSFLPRDWRCESLPPPLRDRKPTTDNRQPFHLSSLIIHH